MITEEIVTELKQIEEAIDNFKICTVPNCCRKVRARDLCKAHYTQHMNGIPVDRLLPLQPREVNKGKTCDIPFCTNSARVKGLCLKHYEWRKPRPKEPLNKVGIYYVGLFDDSYFDINNLFQGLGIDQDLNSLINKY